MLARRATVTVAVVLSALFGLACKEGKSPTEPAAIVATPRPTPTPQPSSSATASLSGIITNQAGVPQPGLLVKCQGQQVNSNTAGAPVGYYGFTRLMPGKTIVGVYPANGGLDELSSFDVELNPGRNTRNLSVVMVHGQPASMSGVVTIQSSRPIEGVTIWCQGLTAVVGANGSYSLTGLESGYWEVGFSWDNWSGEFGTSATLKPGLNTVNFSIPY